MVIVFEISRPFHKWKVERFGRCVRYIWGWFSVAYMGHEFNDIARVFREDERRILLEQISLGETENQKPQ